MKVLSVTNSGAEKECVFPFKYNNIDYDSCITNDDTKYWCSTNPIFQNGDEKGYCKNG